MRKLTLPTIDPVKWSMIFCILVVSFCFRFLVPTEPVDGLVFDEAYFVPQTESYVVGRYFHDPHPPMARMFLYYGIKLFNPDAEQKLDPEKLANKVDGYDTPLDMQGIRFFPKILGSLVPLVVFLLVTELINWRRGPRTLANYLIPFLVGLMVAFENTFIVESRYALLSQPLLLFMISSCWAAVKYYKSPTTRGDVIWFVITALLVGMSVSTKWLAFSITPFIAIMVLAKSWKVSKTAWWQRLLLGGINVVVITYLAGLLYMATYAWHFSLIHEYSPAASEVTESFQDDLRNGTNNTSFWTKFLDVQGLNSNYQSGVPELDYRKDDEIGSMWITWPIMARPINYYWVDLADEGMKAIILIGNPVVWGTGLFGVITLTGLAIAHLLGQSTLFKRHYWLLLLLYFANWLPFALISRVMYMYHYMPALIASIVIFGVVMHDLILPRLIEVLQKLGTKIKGLGVRSKLAAKFSGNKYVRSMRRNLADSVVLVVFLMLTIMTVIGFYFYAPFTYMLPLTEDQFQQRVLLKEWTLRWPKGN